MLLKSSPVAPGAALLSSAPSPALALLVLTMLAPFALYYGTVASMVATWNSSETFAHGYAILPISLWLIWRRRERFGQLPAVPYPPALLLLAVLGAGWLAGRFGDVSVVMQYCFVAMIPTATLALLGPRLAGAFAFPLMFLLFAVPFGEIFIDPLIHVTADFTVWAVQATGIPVLRNGTRFDLPTGSWSVVEACSGIRYLISSITLGSLYAYLTYSSNRRRAVFIALSIVVPIVANGLRAYMIVMIGHYSSMEHATGVDHLVYGWLFFGLIMFIMFWLGSFWRQDETPAPAKPRADAAIDAAVDAPARARAGAARLMPMAVVVIGLLALWPAFSFVNERANLNPAPVQLGEPDIRLAQASDFPDWQVRYMEPDARLLRTWQVPGAERPVRLEILYYRNQDKQKGLISSVNRLTGNKDAFHPLTSSNRSETFGARALPLRETILNSSNGKLLVWQTMWINGDYLTSNVAGKLRQAQGRLLFQGDDGAAVLLAVPYNDDPKTARAALRAFVAGHFGAVDTALQATRER
ncbi:exosortase A [Massilia puerhi]|uniref:exosortase A n=1 Tax=Massilia puerhi TaxID=2681550 RepID=UPI0013571498|nr:exosortase A [Massilia puerhi]